MNSITAPSKNRLKESALNMIKNAVYALLENDTIEAREKLATVTRIAQQQAGLTDKEVQDLKIEDAPAMNKQTLEKVKTTKEKSKISFVQVYHINRNGVHFYEPACNTRRYIAVNELGQKGYLPGEDKAYMPIGGLKVLKMKEIQDVLVWK